MPHLCYIFLFYIARSGQKDDLVHRIISKMVGKDLTSSAHPFPCPKTISAMPSLFKKTSADGGSQCLATPAARRFSLVPKLNLSHCNLSPIPTRHRKPITPFPQLPSTHLKTGTLFPLSLFSLRRRVEPSHRPHLRSPPACRYHIKHL